MVHSLNITPRETSPLLNSLIRKWRNNEQFSPSNNNNANNLPQKNLNNHTANTMDMPLNNGSNRPKMNYFDKKSDQVESGDIFEIKSV